MVQDKFGYKKLSVFNNSYHLALKIHQISKSFPESEKYLLISQIRRSSRSVSANIAEAYGKRRYLKNFISKLTDADGEVGETILWLDFALDFEYITRIQQANLVQDYHEIGKMIGGMMKHPHKFLPRNLKTK